MKTLPRRAVLAAVLVTSASALCAQEPAAPTPGAVPADNKAPAEVVPPKGPVTPAPGQKTAEPPDRKESLSPGTKPPEADPAIERKAGVDAIPDAELDRALSALKERFVVPAALSETELKRATLQGLLDRLGAGATLEKTANDASKAGSPFRSEVIDGKTGYLRLGSAIPANIGALDAALKGFGDQKLSAVILDLRATPPGTDLEAAAEVCRRFSAKGKVLFSVRRRDSKEQIFTSKDDPRYRGLLAVLVDRDTAGVGEVIAAALRVQAGAMVIGQKTAGKAAEFTEVPLSGGQVLQVAVAEIAVADTAPLFPGGVKPDLSVDVTPDVTAAVLKQELEGGVAPLISESERPRMNEAALVAGTNPELEAAIAAQRSRGERAKAPLRDAVLQRALDFITSVTIYEKGTRAKK